MIKLKSILTEGFAWERRADGSLPTIADTTAAYEAKMQEQAELNMPFTGDESEAEEDEVKEARRAHDDEDIEDLMGDPHPDDQAEMDADEKRNKKRRWQDDDGDGKWYEPEDVNETFITRGGLQEMREMPLADRIRKNLLGNR